jgi:hypothetical protein
MSEWKDREELALSVDEAEWQWLKPHLERGALITVSGVLELAEVGERISADDTTAVSAWINAGRIGKPMAEDIARWDATPGKKFLTLIVSPYVLIQELGTMN